MARKRLLTILAGAVAVIGLQVGSATALDAELDLGGTKIEASVSEDGIEAKVGEDEDGDGKIEAKVSDDGVDAKVGDTEVSTKEVTDQVEEAAKEVTETVTEPEPEDDATQPVDRDDEASENTSEQYSVGGQVTTAGDADTAPERDPADRPASLDPAQASQLLPGFRSSGGEVSPAFGFSTSGDRDFEAPMVAAAPSQGGDWTSVSPEGEQSDAELAAIPAPGDGNAVPAGLKLLAGLLVAGTGTLWHLTRRELAPVTTGLRAS